MVYRPNQQDHLEMNAKKIRLIYLFIYMAFGFWRVFYNVYLEDIGLSGAAIGTINAIMQSSVIVVIAIWGIVADRNGIRPILRWLVLISAILVCGLGFAKDFWVVVIYIFVLTCFHHPLGPLTDAMSVQFVGARKEHSYGGFRSWGSLGWAIASIVGGVMFTYVDLKYAFPLSAAFFLVPAWLLRTPKIRKTIYRPNFQPIDIRLVFSDFRLLFFVLLLSVYGLASSPINAYINLFFKELGVGNNTIGLAYALQAFSEVPFFFIGSKLVSKIGARRVILISMAFMALRMFVYGATTNIAVLLFMGVLQGITLSFFLVGAVEFVHRLLPEGRHATAQSLIWGLYFGIGHTFGNLVIGLMKDHFGMAGVMNRFSYIVMAIFIVTAIYFYTARLKNKVVN